MIRYWKYVIQPLAEQNGYKNIAIYNGSKALFWSVFEYCKKNNGLLLVDNNNDFLDEAFLKANQETIVLASESESVPECQIILMEHISAYRNLKDDLQKVKFADCRLFASNANYSEGDIEEQLPVEKTYGMVKAVPFGGMNFWVEENVKEFLKGFLRTDAFWLAVEAERQELEIKLKKKSINSFTHRSKVYNAEAVLRKDEINKVKKEYNEKIAKIKNSKRYKIGSKLVDMKNMVSFGSKEKASEEKKIPAKKVLDQLVQDLEVRTPEEVYKTWLNYSPIIKSIKVPLTENEQTVLQKMEQDKAQDKEKYSAYDQKELVSVIMPTFNRGVIISGAIDSVLRQSYQNFELLVIDDFSTDDTEEVLKKYAGDDRVKVLKNTHIKGVCGARNTGLENAKGRYFAYLDTDNEWEEDYLLLSVQKLKEQPEYHSIYSAQRVWGVKDDEIKVKAYRFGM